MPSRARRECVHRPAALFEFAWITVKIRQKAHFSAGQPSPTLFVNGFPKLRTLYVVCALTVADRQKSPLIAECAFSVSSALNAGVLGSVLSVGAWQA